MSEATTGSRPGPSFPPITARSGVSLRSFAAMLLLAVMWGLSIPVTKLGLQTTDPMTLTAMRFAVAVPLLLFFVVGRQPMPWRALPRVAGLAGC